MNDSVCLENKAPKGKLSLEELNQARGELRELINKIQAEKRNHNFHLLKQVADSLELITSKLEKMEGQMSEIRREINHEK